MEEFEVHVQWLSIATKRLLGFAEDQSRTALLSLSFARDVALFPCGGFRPRDPLTIDDLATGVPYATIVKTLREFSQRSDNLFTDILANLSSLGYNPAGPCDAALLAQGSKLQHVELVKLVEWAVVDRALSIEMVVSDLRRLPRSFFVLKTQPLMIEDAVSLWLAKFPCSHSLPEISALRDDILLGQHVAMALSRVYPAQIPQGKVHVGSELSPDMVSENWALAVPLLDELGAFVPPRQKLSCDHILYLFFAGIFYATRPGVKKFVVFERPPPPQLKPIISPEKIMAKPPQPQKARTPPRIVQPKKGKPVPKLKPVEEPPLPSPPSAGQTDSGHDQTPHKPSPRRKSALISPPRPVGRQQTFDDDTNPPADAPSLPVDDQDDAAFEQHLAAALGEFGLCSPDEKTLDRLYAILRRRFAPDVPDAWIRRHFDRMMALLRSVAGGDDPCEAGKAMVARVTFDLPGIGERTSFELCSPVVAFEHPDASPGQAEPVDVIIRHLPFRRFGGSRRLSGMTRSTQIIPNLKTIVAMIRFNVMPSPQLEQERNQITRFLNEFKDDHLLLLMSGLGMKMKAIYHMENCGAAAVLKIWGNGPEKVPETDVDVF
jgi:hypothetical protein